MTEKVRPSTSTRSGVPLVANWTAIDLVVLSFFPALVDAYGALLTAWEELAGR
ncbi:hypothetical protein [Citricoccus muralis]|uniref:hypothetical protein n=1 Tax=Citricoccus muralis TaxID=169134 RepID=UPI0014760930|nr:hypothetical protein [Citricoccus muralis]